MRSFVIGIMASLALTAAAGARDLTVERLFDAPDLQGPSLRQPRFSPDGTLVSYLRGKDDDPQVYDLWAYDIATAQHRLLVDSRSLAPSGETLSAEEEARRERQRTAALRGIVEYQWAPDSHALLFPLGGDLYHYDLSKPTNETVRRLTTTGSYETDPQYSPKGHYVSFIRDQDLYAVEVATGAERRLTTGGGGLISNGVAEFIAQEEMNRNTGYWWSADESHIAFARVDESPVAELERFEVQAGGFRVLSQRYPAAGAANADVRLGVLALDTGEIAWADLGLTDHYLARVNWFPEGDQILVQRQARNQKRLDLLGFPVTGGSGRLLFSETSDTWVDLHDDLYFLPRRKELLWASQRTGHNHLYRYGYDGRPKGAVTAGDWDVIGEWQAPAVRGIDEKRGRVYFMATLKTPLERQLYVASLDAGSQRAPRPLTSQDGWHNITMSQDAQRYLQVYSDPLQPPQLSLHDATGKRRAWLIENRLDDQHPYAPYLDRHVKPEFGTLPAVDGTPLYWQLYKPAGFEPGRRYPAILLVYGGPTVQTVTRHWGERRGGQTAQLFTQRGYVVFAIDNRGSDGRGQAFTAALYRHLAGVEVVDQLKGVEWLKQQPFVDASRVGVFGWSYGGYMTLMLMMQSPGSFAAGVAGAPVTDWRLYDTHYTEHYLGMPDENVEGYRQSNALTYAGALRDRLLVMHGMADDNVLFTHTTLLIKELVAAGRTFEVMPYPGSKHGALSFKETGIHGWNTILDFFDRQLGAQLGAGSQVRSAP
ncbi:MAG: S9 family peptidase [Gammaproteobacteria bacterium]|nr:S9 family peptidase [Gammaproteobacteria bacterium]